MKILSVRPMWAGFALFFSMYYVLEANPDILKDIGIPPSAALLGTFLAIIAGNFSGALATKTGLVIAPAIGISAFVKNFVLNSDQVIDWRHALTACLIAGILVTITSWLTDLRDKIVKDLPDSVKKGAKAGIGALLVKEGFDMFKKAEQSYQLEWRWASIAVAVAVFILVLFFLIRRWNEETAADRSPFLRFALHLEFLIVVVFMFAYLWIFQPQYISQLPASDHVSFLWSCPIVRESWHVDFKVFLFMLVLTATVWFIVISDIPGTPSEVLPEDWKVDGKTREQAVRSGYINDGVFAALSPLAGTTPTIYYAENQILKSFGQKGEYSPAVGYWVAGLFTVVLVILVMGQLWPALQIPLRQILSPIAIMPILIFIGLYIISVSFFDVPTTAEDKKDKKDKKVAAPKKSGDQAAAAPGLEYYFPAAISVILTARIGLEYALPLSILSFWLVKPKNAVYGNSFIWISGGSALSLVIFVALFVFSSDAEKKTNGLSKPSIEKCEVVGFIPQGDMNVLAKRLQIS